MRRELSKIQQEFFELNKVALNAFKKGSKTIIEAKDTFNRLIYFQENNERTSEMERFALEKVPKIRKKIREAQRIVSEAQTGVLGGLKNAEEARKKALEVKIDLNDLARVSFEASFQLKF